MKQQTLKLRRQQSVWRSYRTLFRDLVALPFWARAFLIAISIFILWNNFFDLNHFISPKSHPTIWIFLNNRQYPLWKQVFLGFTGIASIANIISIVLLAYGKITNYFWGIIGVISYGLYALSWDYLGDMQLYLMFFLPLQFIGYYYWRNHLDESNSIIIHKLNLTKWLITIYALILLTVLFYFEIPGFATQVLGYYAFNGTTSDKIIPHILDAATNGISITAQILLLLRCREQWIMWIIVDILQFIMYAGVAHHEIDLNMLILWTASLINAVIGAYQWYFVLKDEPAKPDPDPTIKHLQTNKQARYYDDF